MTRDSSTKLSKKDQNKRSNKKAESDLKKKKNEESDSDNGSNNDSENEEMDMHEFRKYIQNIFPSKHIENKIKAGNKLKKICEDSSCEENSDSDSEFKKECPTVHKAINSKKNKKNKKTKPESDDETWETASESEEIVEKKNKKNKNKKNKNKKNKKIEVSDDDSVSLGSEDTEDDSSDEEIGNGKKGKINIIFTIGGTGEEEDEYADSDYDDSGDEDTEDTEDEDESVSSDDSDDDEESEEEESEEEASEGEVIVKKKSSKKSTKKSEEKSNKIDDIIADDKHEDKTEILAQLKEILSKNPKDKSIEKCIDFYEQDIKKEKKREEKKEKKQKAKNMRIFRKIITDKNTMNDFSFYEKLEKENQKKLIKELREINKITRIEKPYRMTLLEADIPIQFKAAAMKKVNSLKYMEPGSGEFYKIKNWVDTFMKIPFTNYQSLPLSIEDGVEKCHEFMEDSQKILDQAVYGLNDAKMQIMQMLGQLLTNPKAIGTAIAIHGPPGTGKTSLVKEGISKILNRPFAFIALGGATDSSFLEGHGYTYEGSTWGKIVQIIIDSKCMNPVIYFDELDKISDTPRGEEIAGILTHLTDTSQNSEFHDKYFAEINFDLSKCLFIFSYNDESKVNSILKDRMYRIKTKGYSGKEKTVIANNYLLPKIREQVRFDDGDIIIPDDVLSYINETHCHKEDGVRNMKRCLEIIYTKLNLYRLMKPNSNLFEGEMSLKVEFPLKVTKDIVDKLIKKESDGLETWRSLYL
jgi:ATP-dependent Lon protease